MLQHINNPRITLTSAGWRGLLAEIRAMVDERSQYSAVYTDRERIGANAAVQEAQQRHWNNIYQGAVAEQNAAIDNIKQAAQMKAKAKAASILQDDPAKLAAHLTVFRLRVDSAMRATGIQGGGFSGASEGGTGGGTIGQRLAALAKEAKASGDHTVQRAWAEVATSLEDGANLQGDDRLTASSLARAAHDDLRALSVTPALLSAKAAEKAAIENYTKLLAEMQDADNLLAGPDPNNPFVHNAGPFGRDLKRVQLDGNKITIYEPNDPDVLGYDLTKIPGGPDRPPVFTDEL